MSQLLGTIKPDLAQCPASTIMENGCRSLWVTNPGPWDNTLSHECLHWHATTIYPHQLLSEFGLYVRPVDEEQHAPHERRGRRVRARVEQLDNDLERVVLCHGPSSVIASYKLIKTAYNTIIMLPLHIY